MAKGPAEGGGSPRGTWGRVAPSVLATALGPSVPPPPCEGCFSPVSTEPHPGNGPRSPFPGSPKICVPSPPPHPGNSGAQRGAIYFSMPKEPSAGGGWGWEGEEKPPSAPPRPRAAVGAP